MNLKEQRRKLAGATGGSSPSTTRSLAIINLLALARGDRLLILEVQDWSPSLDLILLLLVLWWLREGNKRGRTLTLAALGVVGGDDVVGLGQVEVVSVPRVVVLTTQGTRTSTGTTSSTSRGCWLDWGNSWARSTSARASWCAWGGGKWLGGDARERGGGGRGLDLGIPVEMVSTRRSY